MFSKFAEFSNNLLSKGREIRSKKQVAEQAWEDHQEWKGRVVETEFIYASIDNQKKVKLDCDPPVRVEILEDDPEIKFYEDENGDPICIPMWKVQLTDPDDIEEVNILEAKIEGIKRDLRSGYIWPAWTEVQELTVEDKFRRWQN